MIMKNGAAWMIMITGMTAGIIPTTIIAHGRQLSHWVLVLGIIICIRIMHIRLIGIIRGTPATTHIIQLCIIRIQPFITGR